MNRVVTGPGNIAARNGITLLEVILSTAIFLGALTAILQVMQLGHESRLSAKLDADAVLRCESIMGKLVSGMLPLASVSNQAFEEDEGVGNWVYSVEVGDSGSADLLLLTVQVDHVIADQQPNSSFALARLMRDPQLFIDASLSSDSEGDE